MRKYLFVSVQLSLLMYLFLVARPCGATIIAYTFQGSVSSAIGNPSTPTPDTPFGQPVTVGTNNVSGHFYYDTTSAGIVVSASSTKYLQHQTDGLVAIFNGAYKFSANDYLVTVSDNLSGTRDQVDIGFRNDALLSAYSLYVNDVAQLPFTGTLIVSLRFGISEFSGTSLPLHSGDLHNSNLTVSPSSSFLGDTFSPDDLFTVNSIAVTTPPSQVTDVVPEPAAGILAALTLAVFLALRRLLRMR